MRSHPTWWAVSMITTLWNTLVCVGNFTCNSQNEFACQNGGGCITISWRCDNTSDCSDLSDEQNCEGMHVCYNSRSKVHRLFISIYYLLFTCSIYAFSKRFAQTAISCFDCHLVSSGLLMSHSDWILVHLSLGRECGKGAFRCTNSLCIPSSFKCDGQDDCLDNSDEKDYVCGKSEILCSTFPHTNIYNAMYTRTYARICILISFVSIHIKTQNVPLKNCIVHTNVLVRWWQHRKLW